MAKKLIRTSKEIIPVIYAYTTPDYPPHDGWTKIGDTRYGADRRIEQQVGTADITYKREWVMNAVYEGTTETFRDYAFHAYLQKQGVERKTRVNSKGKTVNTEWFKIEPMDARNRLVNFKADKGILEALGAIPYSLRDEQIEAVAQTKEYFEAHAENQPEFLWNAKPRFGKTLTAYDLCTALKAKNILIVTNRPAIANSWYSDYEKFFGTESGYYFISENDSLKGKEAVYTYTYKQLVEDIRTRPNYKGCIMFVSLQDLKGSLFMGGKHDKLEYLTTESFDVLIVDEAHEGVDTSKTDLAFRKIRRKYTLHLSGTPFKALANDKFEVAAIFNWTYADEQKAKRDWNDIDRSNPYVDLPRLNLLTYRMSDITLAKVKQGADFDNDGENEAYAFDLNEFFKTYDSGKNKGEFIHDADIDLFLDQLVTTEKFPFSEEYRDELQHTLWLLNRVASAKALYKKLKAHPVFKDYEIVLAAGDGKAEENGVADETEVKKSYDKVVKAIAENDKTITISVGQLTTGITIPEWTGVMMLSNMQSPALYMQAAFRSQNPYTYTKEGKTYRKENAYVFDFDPARTLDIFEQFATGLYSDTTGNKGDIDTRKNRVRELINYFPVYGENNTGGMVELDAEQVLSIPRQIHAQEVVRKGFMSNFLFQNIAGVFSAPKAVTDILTKLDATKEPIWVTNKTAEELNINADGEVEIPVEKVEEQVAQVFGDKIYSDLDIGYLVDAVEGEKEKNRGKKAKSVFDELKQTLHNKTDELISVAKDKYGKDLSKSSQAKMIREINKAADDAVAQRFGDYKIEGNRIENERQKAVAQAESEGRIADIEGINARANEAHENNIRHFEESMLDVIPDTTKKAAETIVKIQETDKCEKEKKSIEGDIRDRLRGFSRTIPSFLMAYGDEYTTLENFDDIIPENVFIEVTGITVDEFRFLRDGGDYTAEDGSTKHFEGHLFDSVVFNDSVVEFLRKRDELSDYFADGVVEDIFDYIPPQRTNQIFTPKKVVKQMVDYLEQENPGCFDSMDATFIDPYMKSGLYITEIVKRLFNNKEHKEIFPDEIERLHWIFETQVYGLAPTEIIYRITTNYILGFSKKQEWIDKCKEKNFVISDAHFRQCDSLPYAQGNEKLTLEQKLTELFK